MRLSVRASRVCLLVLVALLPRAANAGGFAVHSESTYFLGSSLAGAAAGGTLSSMFWNPAALAQFEGIWSESAYTLHLTDGNIHALPDSTLVPFGFPADSGVFPRDVLVPAGYVSYQISPSVVFGLSINAPFGLGTKTNEIWAGQTMSRENKLETYNFTPTIGYRVGSALTIGAGLQVEYIRARLHAAVPLPSPPFPALSFANATNEGDDLSVGFTLGALWEPNPGTSIGLGFRSSIDHSFEGSFIVHGFSENDATADLETPEVVTLSLRQVVAPEWTALATVQWTNWSRLDKLDTICTSGPPSLPCPAPGATISSLAFGWHDGWLFSGALEYAYSKDLTLRGGGAYELSPIRNPDERPVQLPDSDRIWVSAGASYKLNWCGTWCDESSLELAYVHLFFEDATINRTELGITLHAETDARDDIISVGFKTKWGGTTRTAESIK